MKRRLSFPLPVIRKRSSSSANFRHKAEALARGPLSCESCNFFDHRYPPYGLLESHHVQPRSLGGSDSSSNYAILCPTCHAAADRLCRQNPHLTKSMLLSMLRLKSPRTEVHEMPVSSDAVWRKKHELLRTPISAHATAVREAQHALEQGWDEVKDTYLAVADELKKEGYAPTESGQPGPAVAKFYKDEAERKAKSRDLTSEAKPCP